MRSLIAAPIGSDSAGHFGVLGVCSREAHAFSKDDRSFVEAVANIVSSCFELEHGERQIEHAQSRLEDFWNLSTDLLAVFSPEGRFVEASGSWRQILGWSREELIDRDVARLVHRDDRADMLDDGAATLSCKPSTMGLIIRLRAKDDSYRWFSWSVRRASDGFLYAAAKDVSERHDAEQERERSERMLNETQRIAGMGSFEIDLTTGVHRISANLRDMLQFDSTTIDDEAFLQRVHPSDRPRLRENMEAQAAGFGDGPGEFRIQLPDGSVFWFTTSVEVIVEEEGGNPIGMRGTVQDITVAERPTASCAGRRSAFARASRRHRCR